MGLVDAYRNYFKVVASSITKLDVQNEFPTSEGWSKMEWLVFGRALPSFECCQNLSLAGHKLLDDDIVQELYPGLRKLRTLQSLQLEGCGFTQLGLSPILNLLNELPLQTLRLPKNLKDTDQGSGLQRKW